VLCPNDFLDPGEECDGGAFCLLTCHCVPGFISDDALGCKPQPLAPSPTGSSPTPTPTPSVNLCGNLVIDAGEDCDGGTGCLSTCTCAPGHLSDGSGGCVVAPSPSPRCGNRVKEAGEDCDRGLNCLNLCKCPPGYFADGTSLYLLPFLFCDSHSLGKTIPGCSKGTSSPTPTPTTKIHPNTVSASPSLYIAFACSLLSFLALLL